MMLTDAIYPPVSLLKGIERLDLLDWDEIHGAVQSTLQRLDDPVTRLCVGCRVTSGHNSAPAWQLFSYRVYQPPEGSEVDPVVVGVNFSHGSQGAVRILGDISGETLGDVLYEFPEVEAVGTQPVLEKAQDLAEKLAKQADRIAGALANSAR